MITNDNNRKQLIDFLIYRWQSIINSAAVEKVYIASYNFAEANNLPIPQAPYFTIPQACRQIEIIKQHIIQILPEANFINYNYEAPAPLNPNDFVEVFIADHNQCISKIKNVVKRMQIT